MPFFYQFSYNIYAFISASTYSRKASATNSRTDSSCRYGNEILAVLSCIGVASDVTNLSLQFFYRVQLALTHPSYRWNYGTNPDHARNSLTNCGLRQVEYGDRRIHYIHTRKRGMSEVLLSDLKRVIMRLV